VHSLLCRFVTAGNFLATHSVILVFGYSALVCYLTTFDHIAYVVTSSGCQMLECLNSCSAGSWTMWGMILVDNARDRRRVNLRACDIDHTNCEMTAAAGTTWRSTIRDAVEEFEVWRLESAKTRRTKRKSSAPVDARSATVFRCDMCGMTHGCVGLTSTSLVT